MICDQCHIGLPKAIHGSTLWHNIAEELMVGFALGLLVRAVGVAEKNPCALSAEDGTLHALNIGELMAVVCKDKREARGKELPAQSFFYDVKHTDHRRGIMVFESKVKLHMKRGKMQAQDGAMIRGGTFDTVHLNGRDIITADKVQVVLVKVPGFRSRRGWMCVRFSAGLSFHRLRKVDHPDIQFTAFDQPAQGGFADGKGIPV